jgi:hypothetical protein
VQSLRDVVVDRLADLNRTLRQRGDTARVRFASIEPDPDFEGEELVLVTWELSRPDGGDDWALEMLDDYCKLVAEALAETGVTTECLFRSPSELAEQGELGVRVPEAA